MTIQQLHRAVRIQFGAVAAQTLDNFLPEEIDHYINRAVRTLIDKRRASLLSDRESIQGHEIMEDLYPVIQSHTFQSSDFTQDADLGAYTLPISDLDPAFEYFIHGRFKSGSTIYNVEQSSIEAFYEHLPTKHNTPIFRKPIIIQRADNFLIALPDGTGTPSALELTYIGTFVPAKLLLEWNIEVEDAQSPGSDLATITVQGAEYELTYNTDPETTITDFITANGSDLWNLHSINIEQNPAGTLHMVSRSMELDIGDIIVDDAGSPIDTTLTTTEPFPCPLPHPTHQDIVDLTVNLIRQDLPQSPNPESRDS